MVRGAVEKIERSLKNVEKGKLSSHEMGQILERIPPTTHVENLKNANLIVEAVFEDIELKIGLLRKLNDLCHHEPIFASNTSTLSITRMAATVSPSERFLGLHFFNSVPLMRQVEVSANKRLDDPYMAQGN